MSRKSVLDLKIEYEQPIDAIWLRQGKDLIVLGAGKIDDLIDALIDVKADGIARTVDVIASTQDRKEQT